MTSCEACCQRPRLALAPPRVVLQRAGQHHAADRGLDEIGVGVRDPVGRVADLAPVARQRLAGRVRADRKPEREAAEEGLVAQQRGHAVADAARRFPAGGHHAASRSTAGVPKYPANFSISASASRFTWRRTFGLKVGRRPERRRIGVGDPVLHLLAEPREPVVPEDVEAGHHVHQVAHVGDHRVAEDERLAVVPVVGAGAPRPAPPPRRGAGRDRPRHRAGAPRSRARCRASPAPCRGSRASP